jgi:hypothetical protein
VLRLTDHTDHAATDQSLADRIGRYQLVGRLAKGGMAEAYVALSGELPGLRSLVVLKRILPHLSSNEQFVRMFLDEARIGTLLDHPNVVRIIEVGHDVDGYFLAMEPVQGKSLSAVLRRAVLRKSPIGHAQAAFIVGQAADGLGYAHGLADAEGHPLNVVHRDVSPENILVSFEGAVKVIDFGIASALGRLTETVPGGLKGKIEYMSPEQVAGDVVDRRSDVFALGAVLWEALSGRRLFRRETELGTMRAIVDEPIPRPSGNVPVSPRLERIVMRALEKDPEDRFQDGREMALLLQRHAFASDGFSPAGLAAQMKRLFAADHAGWTATANAALEIEGRRSRKITATFPLAPNTDALTSGATVALHVGRPEIPWAATHRDPPGDAGEPSTPGPIPGGRPPQHAWIWAVGGIVLVGLIVAAGLTLRRPGTAPTRMIVNANAAERSSASVPRPHSEWRPPTPAASSLPPADPVALSTERPARAPATVPRPAQLPHRETTLHEASGAMPPRRPPAARVSHDDHAASATRRRDTVPVAKPAARRKTANYRTPLLAAPPHSKARPEVRKGWQDPFK